MFSQVTKLVKRQCGAWKLPQEGPSCPDGKSYGNYDGPSLSTNIALREIHLFPQETWLQKAKSLLQKNGVKGHVCLET